MDEGRMEKSGLFERIGNISNKFDHRLVWHKRTSGISLDNCFSVLQIEK
jgi:hypothetical protein